MFTETEAVVHQHIQQMVREIKVPRWLRDDAIQQGWLEYLQLKQADEILEVLWFDMVKIALKKWLRDEIAWRQGTLA